MVRMMILKRVVPLTERTTTSHNLGINDVPVAEIFVDSTAPGDETFYALLDHAPAVLFE